MARHSRRPSALPALPREPVDRVLDPLVRFLHVESASGLVLVACAAAALILANSPLAAEYLAFWKTPVGLQLGGLAIVHSLKHWINDGLMAIFFFVIGLEVKRELVLGELRDLRRAALPIAAALGGMVVPAGIYLAMQFGQEGVRGWGIPMATDIAFVIGCIALLGRRVPHGLRVMLLSLAIVDDLGAILVIAVGYTEHIGLGALGLAFLGMALVVCLTRLGVRNVGIYTLLGVLVWFAFHQSGLHATIAGVILGLLTPARSWVSKGLLGQTIQKASQVLTGDWDEGRQADRGVLRQVELATREAVSPLERLEAALHPWVSFGIMPLFALANAGVPVNATDVVAPVSLAVMAGLVIGKPLGIVLFSWLAVRLGLAQLPERIGWGPMVGAGCLAGIGFTMALFITGLALKGNLQDVAKIGVLGGSLLSAALGMVLLFRLLPRAQSMAG